MAQRTELGDHFYIWHPAGQIGVNPMLLISAHGAQTFGRSQVPVPFGAGVTFLGPRHYSLLVEPCVEYFHYSNVQTYERGGATIENYNLSKFQKPGGRRTANGMIFEDSYDRLAALDSGLMRAQGTDVVTVRHRFDLLQRDKTIADLFRLLAAQGLRYSEFICYFCRDRAFSLGKPKEYRARFIP
ncbi:putative adhesin [Sphingomonas morindae]|uniref:Putative adhesin Stv domain-containing protein n=1 Tax=Sphingomonas morindae TaxID=1541170 RepID=A0ABY4X7Z8_9SPHN|nr:hypothetical protein [Sphingomonas morindae]USI72994.1 hypothetical protein LHA26_00500 [Sphingomonas morindae]